MEFRFNICDKGDLWVFPEGEAEYISSLINKKPTITQSHAELIIHGDQVVKKIRPQRLKDHLRKFFRSQAKREALSSGYLTKLGISAPEIYGYGINISPIGTYESILLMEYIPNLGTLREILQSDLNSNVRSELLEQLKENLRCMIDAGVYHKDAHLGNILVTYDYHLVWIDNDFSPIKGPRELHKLLKRFNNSPLLSEDEKSHFFPNHLPG